MITNRVSTTLATTAQEKVIAAIATIRENLPFLVDLTGEERASLSKLGDKSQAFVKKALDIATQHPALLPQGFVEEMRRDAELFEALEPIQLAIDLLAKQVDDTRLQVGAEYYAAARTVYATSKTPFAQAALRTATVDLGRRYGRRSRTEPAVVTPASPQPPSPPNGNS